MSAQSLSAQQQPAFQGDHLLVVVSLVLVLFGTVMMTSASIEIASSQYSDALYHLKRQLRFLAIGLIASTVVLVIPTRVWKQLAVPLLIIAIGLLALVLVPGIGREVNGSRRWLNLGFMSVQVSEPAKVFLIVFMAWYLNEYRTFFRETWGGFLLPLLIMALPVVLILQEPDFGAVVVLMAALFGMMFMAGASVLRFLVLLVGAGTGAAFLLLSAEYRVERLNTFMQALADPFAEEVVYGSGYQLAQALIAFGRGEWLGVGLGNGIQKLYFLPEAHTDFVFAIVAEELGLLMVIVLMALFVTLVIRAMLIARRSESAGLLFPSYVAYGLSFLLAGQIMINIAVNVGLVPTKGLTLPFMSYGGSSLIVCIVMIAMLVKIDREAREVSASGQRRKR